MNHSTTVRNPDTRTSAFEELIVFCRQLESPLSQHDVKALAAIHACLRPAMSPEENRLAGRLMNIVHHCY